MTTLQHTAPEPEYREPQRDRKRSHRARELTRTRKQQRAAKRVEA